jgi:hypothetical protein
MFSSINVSSTDGQISFAYVIPIMIGGIFKGAMAVDITVSSLSNQLNEYNDNGFVSYIMEAMATNTYSGIQNPSKYMLVANSNAAPLNTTKGQKIRADVSDSFYISKSAEYLIELEKEEEPFVEGDTTILDDTSVPDLNFEMTRLKYAYSNLKWDIVTTEQLHTYVESSEPIPMTQPPTEAPTGIPASISFDQDDEVAMQTRDIAAATLAFVVVGFVIAVSYFYYQGKNIVVTPSTSSSPMHSKQEL